MAERGPGRPKKAGTVYYLGRLRWRPGVDPPELRDFLVSLEDAGPARRREMLRSALTGGIEQGQAVADRVEDEETAVLMDDLLSTF